MLRKDVGPFLIEQRCHFARIASRLIDRARFFAAFDVTPICRSPTYMSIVSTAAMCGSGNTYTASILSAAVFWNSCVTVTRDRNPVMSAFTSVCFSGHSEARLAILIEREQSSFGDRAWDRCRLTSPAA